MSTTVLSSPTANTTGRLDANANHAKSKPHQVTITEFLDDYKPRGGDWSSTRVHCFMSKRAADRFLWKYLHDWVAEQRSYDDDDDDEDEDWREAHRSLHAMELYAGCFNHGEYVPHKIRWHVEEMVFEDDDGDEDTKGSGVECGCAVTLTSPDSSDEADSSSMSSSGEMDMAADKAGGDAEKSPPSQITVPVQTTNNNDAASQSATAGGAAAS